MLVVVTWGDAAEEDGLELVHARVCGEEKSWVVVKAHTGLAAQKAWACCLGDEDE